MSASQSIFTGFQTTQNQAERYLANLNNSVRNGRIPSLQELNQSLSGINPDSPQAFTLSAKTRDILGQFGEAGRLRADELDTSRSILQMDNVTLSLFSLQGNLEPESIANVELQKRLSLINSQKASLQSRLNADLNRDSSHGGEIRLGSTTPDRSSQAPANQQILQVMIQLFSVMLSLFSGQAAKQEPPYPYVPFRN